MTESKKKAARAEEAANIDAQLLEFLLALSPSVDRLKEASSKTISESKALSQEAKRTSSASHLIRKVSFK